MADVVECSKCFGEVHPNATRCRHCGASFETPWYARWSVIIPTALVLVFGIWWGVSAAFSNAKDNADRHADEMLCEIDATSC